MNVNIDGYARDHLHSVAPAIQLSVRHKGREIFRSSSGKSAPDEANTEISDDTQFDIASVTKLFTASAFMLLVQRGMLSLDDRLSTRCPNVVLQLYGSVEHKIAPHKSEKPLAQQMGFEDISFRHLLLHTSGLEPSVTLDHLTEKQSVVAAIGRTSLKANPGHKYIYSDLGFILLGQAISEITGKSLEEIINELIIKPLKLKKTEFCPRHSRDPYDLFAATEWCRKRGRRVIGEVHDEKAWLMGGVAGHAGLFSNATDLSLFGATFIDGETFMGAISKEMTQPYHVGECAYRGLGFAFYHNFDNVEPDTMSAYSFGHTGFTGTSLWIDPSRDLVVACLTNRVYYGRENMAIAGFRREIHRHIISLVDTEKF